MSPHRAGLLGALLETLRIICSGVTRRVSDSAGLGMRGRTRGIAAFLFAEPPARLRRRGRSFLSPQPAPDFAGRRAFILDGARFGVLCFRVHAASGGVLRFRIPQPAGGRIPGHRGRCANILGESLLRAAGGLRAFPPAWEASESPRNAVKIAHACRCAPRLQCARPAESRPARPCEFLKCCNKSGAPLSLHATLPSGLRRRAGMGHPFF